MTVTFSPMSWKDRQTMVLSWSSSLSDPLYYVYRDGQLITATYAESLTFYVAPGETPIIEVIDTVADPVYSMPGRRWLSWYPDTDTEYYLIEEATQGLYSETARITESGLGYYRFLTRWLADGYGSTWRITPVDAAGNRGDPLTFVVVQVRHPDPPGVSYSYDDTTHKVTIVTTAVAEGEGAMAEEFISFDATGSGALSETITAGTAKNLYEVRLVITSGTTDMSGLSVTIGPKTANTTANTVFEPVAADVAAVSNVIHRFETPAFVDSDQTIIVAWANSGSKTWELEIIYKTE